MSEQEKTSQRYVSETRFSYVQYDEKAIVLQSEFKERFVQLADRVETTLPNGRAKALVLTKLEEAYMWVGKAIRDDQVGRNVPSPELPGRANS